MEPNQNLNQLNQQVDSIPQTPAPQSLNTISQQPQPIQQPIEKHAGKGLSIAALILGIAGFVLFWIPLLGLGSAITGVVLGIVALVKKSDGKGMAIAGLICGGLGVIPGIIIIIMGAAILSLLGIAVGGATTLMSEYDQYLNNPITYCLENPSYSYCYGDDDWEWDYDYEYDYDYDYDYDTTTEKSMRF